MQAAHVVTVSDRSARGERADGTGPVLVDRLRAAGWAVDDASVVPDGAASVRDAIAAALAAGARLVVTTGGTGVGPRDETPEGTVPLLTRMLPGIPEEIRRRGGPHGMLSRGVAGVTDRALVVNLPGSPGGAADGIDVVLSVAAHVLSQLDGGDHVAGGGAAVSADAPAAAGGRTAAPASAPAFGPAAASAAAGGSAAASEPAPDSGPAAAPASAGGSA